MDNDIKKLLERQDNWQKIRKGKSWIEKLNESAAARKTLPAYLGSLRKRHPDLNNKSRSS